MRNPLMKRIPREFMQDWGKYAAIFVFMILFVGLISGFLVTTASFAKVYDDGFVEQKVEDGHFSFTEVLPEEVIGVLEQKGNISIYPYFYFDEEIKDTTKTIRVYSTKRELNLICLMQGKLPEKEDEIALDRMFAENNELAIGDTLVLRDKTLTVTGWIASPDYGCLFENNSDTMFDSLNFSVAVMTQEGFESFASSHITYNYAWLYPEFVERTDVETAKKKSDALIEVFEEVVIDYAPKKLLELNDYVPRYINQAINFTGDDMGSDKAMMIVFDYLMTVVLAFVFAITISNTIVTEAGVIGTLRASGYTKGELLSHYLIIPLLVTLVSALIGNILGYTVFCDFVKDIYYGSYSLATYEEVWNAEAFVLTTVIPIVLMLAINFFVLIRKLQLSPLRFLRRDLSKKGKKKAFRLNTKIPFLHRFRTRIIFQNIPNYIMMFLGIFIGGVLVVFGLLFGPLFEDYKKMIVEDRICDYQYVLSVPVETEDPLAEKYMLNSLKTTDERFMEDDVSIFGVEENSAYVEAMPQKDEIVISNGFAIKFGLEQGDTFTLKDPYDEKTRYTFTVDCIITYHSGLAVFMTRADFSEMFDVSEEDYTGYFSNRELVDLDENHIASVITVSDLTKLSDQMIHSLGSMMGVMEAIGIVIFTLLMFIMSKQIIEKNANAISMTKILGFSNGEIGGLYIVATSVVVVLSLLLSIPIMHITLKVLFEQLLYIRMTGYIPFIISPMCYVKMVILGICSYAVVAAFQMIKINRIPKSNALKNVE